MAPRCPMAALIAAACFGFAAGATFVGGPLSLIAPAAAEPAAASDGEKSAFDSAKELGTVEAWDAFLSNYPTGFHADLARAYVKKLAGPAGGGTPQPSAPVEAAYEEACAMAAKLKSHQSTDAVKLRFVNESGAVRVIQWIDFNGALKEYFTLQPGEERVQDTFLTHPWISAYQEGSCSQLFMPGQPESIARLTATTTPAKSSDETNHGPTPYQTCKNAGKVYYNGQCVTAKKKPTQAQSARASCIEIGMIYLNGKCAPKYKTQRQNATKNQGKACPKGMYRNPYGQCQPNETGN